jgi:hypothetical protein
LFERYELKDADVDRMPLFKPRFGHEIATAVLTMALGILLTVDV